MNLNSSCYGAPSVLMPKTLLAWFNKHTFAYPHYKYNLPLPIVDAKNIVTK